MVDMAAIAGVASSLKVAADLTKAMIGLRDAEVMRSKVIELQTAILSAQHSAFEANSAQSALIEEVRGLKRQVADLEAWATEKQRYELVELYGGSLAYAIKKAMRGAEPHHYICAACYQKGQKSLMQGLDSGFGGRALSCPDCKLQITHSIDPNWKPVF